MNNQGLYKILITLNLLVVWMHSGMAGPGYGVAFIENKGQWNHEVDFMSSVPGGYMQLGVQGFSYYLLDANPSHDHDKQEKHRQGIAPEPLYTDKANDAVKGYYVRMAWEGAHATRPVPTGKLPAYYNYFKGADPSQWASEAYAYREVLYPALYNGIDLKVYAQGENVKYDFILEPGADPSQIVGHYEGADKLYLDANGNLYVHTVIGDIIEKQPYAYQFVQGKKISVPCKFKLSGNHLSFSFPQGYDLCEPLIIDPLLIFSTYSGFSADNWGSTATPGENATLYSAGVTYQPPGSFGVTPGVFQTSFKGVFDVGILKYDSAGTDLLYASFLGGESFESPHSLVIDEGTLDLLVLGTTSSSEFPVTTGAYSTTYNGGSPVVSTISTYAHGSDIFVARISSDGTTLKRATYLGGTGNDGLGALGTNYGDDLRGDIIVGDDGDIFISTVTASSNFPGINSFNTTYKGGGSDAVVACLSDDLSQLQWSAFLGGSANDAAYTIKLDSNGDIFVAGGTTSTDFPVTLGAYQTALSGGIEGWIAHIAGDGSAIINATYMGTSAYDQIYFLDMNDDEDIYVYGQTSASRSIFPVSSGVYSSPAGTGQFVQKFSNDLSTLDFSTVFGGGDTTPDISPTAFLVNDCNNLYLAGWGGKINSEGGFWNSNTKGLPITSDAYQSTSSGSDFYFMVLTDDGTELLYATYLGGTSSATHVDGGTSRFDKSGIVYHAVCSGCQAFNTTNAPTSDFPTTQGAWSNVNGSPNCNNAAFKFDLASLRARLQTNSISLDMPGLDQVCLPDSILFQNRCTGGERFVWDFGDGTSIDTSDTTAIPHLYPGEGTYTVTLTAIDPGTCQVQDQTSAVVYVYERESEVQGDDVICGGDTYTLWADHGVTYLWVSEDSTFQSEEQMPTVTPQDTTRYFVTITEISGCQYIDTVNIDVIPGVELEFKAVREGACIERPAIRVLNTTENATDTQMIIDFGDDFTSDLLDVIHTYQEDGVYTIRLTSVRYQCVYEKEISLPVYTLKVPNVITPGKVEGKNDTFQILFGETGLAPYDFDTNVSLTIFNRWGHEVYHNVEYLNNWGAQTVAAGIYFYQFTVEGQATCKSWLKVIK